MSKNLTRKGLAFGALVALGASVFAGAPAYAADSVVLATDYTSDTTFATPVTEGLRLNASLAPGSTAANIAQLKYKIVTDGTIVVKADSVSNGNTVTKYTRTANATAVSVADVFTSGNAANDVLTTTYLTPSTPAPTAVNTLLLSIDAVNGSTITGNTAGTGYAPVAANATKTVTVTAFIDANVNGTLDAGEVSQAQTVSFVKYSELTTSTTITAPTQGDTAVTAVVKFTNVNNEAFVSTKVGAYFTKGDGTTLTPAVPSVASGTFAVANVATLTTAAAHGLKAGQLVTIAGLSAGTGGSMDATYVVATVPSTTTFTVATANKSGAITATSATATPTNVYSGVSFSATAGGFKYVTSVQGALAKSSAVKVQPLFNATSVVTNSSNSVGTAQTASVASRSLGSFTANHVVSTTAKNDGTISGSATAPANGSYTNVVALNSEKQVYFLAKDTASTPAALAGQSVSVTVTTSVTLSSSLTLTVNGTTYTSNAALPGATGVAKLTLTTGSDGKATVTYKTAGYTSGTVTLVGTVENSTATVIGTETARSFTGNTSYIDNNEGDTAVTTDGTAVPVVVVVQDQFGGAPTDGTYQVTATWITNGGGYVAQATTASTIASSTYAAVVGGKASLSITDNGTGLGTNQYLIELRPVAANGVLGAADRTIAAAFSVKIVAAADSVAGDVTVANANGVAAAVSATTGIYSVASGTPGDVATNGIDLTYSSFTNVDTRKIAVDAPAPKKLNGTTGSTVVTITGNVASASTATYGGVAIPSAVVTVSGTGMYFNAAQDAGNVWGDGSVTFEANASGNYSFEVYSHVAGKNTITIKSGTGTATLVVYFKPATVGAATTVTATVADASAQFQAGRALDVVFKVSDKFGNPVVTGAVAGAADSGILSIAQTGSGYLATTGKVITGADGTYTTKLITNAGDLGTSTITATLDMGTLDGGAYNATTNPYLADITKTVSSEFGVTDADVTVGGRAVYASVEFAKGKTVTVTVDGKRLYSKLMSTDNYTELKFTQKTAGKHVVTIRVSGGIVYSETVETTK